MCAGVLNKEKKGSSVDSSEKQEMVGDDGWWEGTRGKR